VKKFLQVLAVLLLSVLLLGAGAMLFLEAPMKTLENFAIRHADKLPLAYVGGLLFDTHCAGCHDNPDMHAPTREALAGFSRESLMIALEFGKMQPMAAHLSKQQRGLITIYLTEGAEQDDGWIEAHRCDDTRAGDGTDYALDWGLGSHNRRFVDSARAGIDRANVASLELAWTLAFPRVTDMRSQPAVVGDTLYFGDKAGRLYAIDRFTGCIRAHTKVFSGIRSAITVATLNSGRRLLVFADSLASIFAVDPQTLETVWQGAARLYDTSVITGSISYFDDKLFVPVSSYEVAVSGSPAHVCCKSHGGVIALDARDGAELWQWHTTAEATLQGHNSAGGELYGPSGAAVWTTPAVDAKRGRIYFGTGENLSRPATDTSDAIIALDMDSGRVAWQFQATADDVWNAACLNGGPNCPDNPGGDFDFGASVIIAEMEDGRELLLAGQKSGEVFALEPDPAGSKGEVVWRNRISDGTTNGGIHWGMGLSGNRLVVPVADPERERPGYTPRPGLYALDMRSGEMLWRQPVTRGCDFDPANNPLIGLENMRAGKQVDLAEQYRCSFYYGLSAAVTVTPELAFSAGLDGIIRAYDIVGGEVLWRARTAVPVTADNGIEGHGGAIDVGGQVIAGGWLYVQSGYSMFGQLPGNVLFAYRVGNPEGTPLTRASD
jgi:polyvinyl alcohol dehydrogenase (cytochrome)